MTTPAITLCPNSLLTSLDLKWLSSGTDIKAHGVVNDAWVTITLVADTISSSIFSSASPPEYRSLAVKITTAPTPHCGSGSNTISFDFRDYSTKSGKLTRVLESWFADFDEKSLYADVLQYINWYTTAGYASY